MDLGEHHLCLDVKSYDASRAFYEMIGFVMVTDHGDEGWGVLRKGSFILSLFEGHIERNLLNFRGGDVEAIGAELAERGIPFVKEPHIESDGSWAAEVHDPDGNVLYFNTYPSEREQYVTEGTTLPQE